MLVYVTCPAVVAAMPQLRLGFNIVPTILANALIQALQAYPLTYPRAFPRLGYCDPNMPAPGPSPAPPPPAPPPAPVPPPAPAPQSSLTIGPEDTVTRIDVDGDGRPDVLVVVDRPPQNP
jgi:hypothetical protein